MVKVTAVFDLLEGFGILLPSLLRRAPKITVFAARGIVVLMISACIFHISRGEGSQIGFKIFVLIMAAFVAWGRQNAYQFTTRKA